MLFFPSVAKHQQIQRYKKRRIIREVFAKKNYANRSNQTSQKTWRKEAPKNRRSYRELTFEHFADFLSARTMNYLSLKRLYQVQHQLNQNNEFFYLPNHLFALILN